MDDPGNDMLILAVIALVALVALLAFLLHRRSRELKGVDELQERLAAITSTGELGERLLPEAAQGQAAGIAEQIDQLIGRARDRVSDH